MHQVTVKRTELLEKVKANRENHRAVFEEAMEGYREDAIKELDGMIAEAKSGKRIRRAVTLPEPVDQTKEYDRVISMLSMSVDENIELDSTSFANYVLDQWSWMPQVSATNFAYLKSNRKG